MEAQLSSLGFQDHPEDQLHPCQLEGTRRWPGMDMPGSWRYHIWPYPTAGKTGIRYVVQCVSSLNCKALLITHLSFSSGLWTGLLIWSLSTSNPCSTTLVELSSKTQVLQASCCLWSNSLNMAFKDLRNQISSFSLALTLK